MGISYKSSSRKPVRSAALPCRSHQHNTDDRIEKLLNKVKTWESTLSSSEPCEEIICHGFSHLTTLYECLEDLFNTNLSNTMKWADVLLDISVKFLDFCSNTTDIISQLKQQVSDIWCDLRRANGGCITKSNIAKYNEFRNKLKKDIKASMACLKQVDNMIHGMIDSESYRLMCVIREVTSFNTVVFRFLLEFLAMRTRQAGRWKRVSKLLSKSKVVPEDATNVNALQRFDASLLRYSSSSDQKQEFIQLVPTHLEAVGATLEGINSHLQVLSRRLILNRVSILNMVSVY